MIQRNQPIYTIQRPIGPVSYVKHLLPHITVSHKQFKISTRNLSTFSWLFNAKPYTTSIQILFPLSTITTPSRCSYSNNANTIVFLEYYQQNYICSLSLSLVVPHALRCVFIRHYCQINRLLNTATVSHMKRFTLLSYIDEYNVKNKKREWHFGWVTITITWPLLLIGCQSWSVTSHSERSHDLENRERCLSHRSCIYIYIWR